ncbi:hypothetical protein [Phormidesmis sp. 146-33]
MKISSIALLLSFATLGLALPAHSQSMPGAFQLNQTKSQTIAQSRGRSFIGLRYRNLPKGLTDLGGWVVGDGTTSRIAVAQVAQGSQQMLWLEKLQDYDSNGRPMYHVIDVLNLPTIKQTERLTAGSRGCTQNGKRDPELAVIVKETNTEKWTQISRAWRANRRTGKFEKISTKGIVCENFAWGV